jgi:hypothetical protein
LKTGKKNNLRFPLRKTGNIFNNTRGDFIIVGGRKHQEKLFFILHVIPLIQKINAKKQGTPLM